MQPLRCLDSNMLPETEVLKSVISSRCEALKAKIHQCRRTRIKLSSKYAKLGNTKEPRSRYGRKNAPLKVIKS